MKKIIGFFAIVFISAGAYGQKSIDGLFAKYSGKDGFVTVSINGNLLKLAASLDDDHKDDTMPKDITMIRILTQDDDAVKLDNFYDLVIKDIDLSQYEEFMKITESGQNVSMLVKTNGNKFTEFLLIAGGKDNALIQIKGIMTFEEAKKFSENAKKEHGANIVVNKK